MGDSITPLKFLALSVVINIILNITFVVWFHMGVAGVAWATVAAQTISFLLCLSFMNRKIDGLHFSLNSLKFNPSIFRRGLQIGSHVGLQQAGISLGVLFLQRIVNSFGTDAVAAFVIGSRIDSFAAIPTINFGMVITTFTAQNLGAGQRERVRRGYWYTLRISFIYYIKCLCSS